jgi:hypothetical protein
MTNTSTPEQAALPTKWFQTEQLAVPSLIITTEIVASDFDDDNVFSESTNNNRKRNKGRKRKAASSRQNTSVGTRDDSMVKLAASQEKLAASQVELAASQVEVHRSHVYGVNLTAMYSTEERLSEMRNRRRTLIKEIGGRAALKMLRENESQDSGCSEIDEMEQEIEMLKKRSVTLQKVCDTYEKNWPPPATPSA